MAERDRGRSEESEKARKLNLGLKATKLRIEKAKADRIEEQREREKANILPRDEYTLTIREIIGLARDRLINEIPREIAKRFPKLRNDIIDIGEDTARKILSDFARQLEQIDANS